MLRNDGSQRSHLDRVDMACWPAESFSPRLDCGLFRQLVHSGRASSSGVKGVGRPGPGLEHVETGSMLAVYQHEDGQGLLLGILPPLGPAFSELRDLHDQPHLEGDFGFNVQHVFECDVDPGTVVQTSPPVALSGGGGVALMQHYAGLWRRAAAAASAGGPSSSLQAADERHDDAGRRIQAACARPARPSAVGWNSWDFYSGAATRQAMDENLDAGQLHLGDALQYLVIDEGWEQQWGSWEPNGKFATGWRACLSPQKQG